MNKKIIVGVLVVCLLAFVVVFAFAQTGTGIRWEYIYTGDYYELNDLGKQGWELVLQDADGDYVLKRRLP
jgi:hypothetical protein